MNTNLETIAVRPEDANMTPEALLVRIKAMKSAFGITKQRCTNPSNPDYRYYGGRGITICDRWLDPEKGFDNYLQDMGLRPEGMTLERVDNEKPYSPENCVWATRLEQTRNTRIAKTLTFNGKTQSWMEWSKELGIGYHTIKARINVLGYTAEEALTKEVRCGGLLPGKAYSPKNYTPVRGEANPVRKLKDSDCEDIRLAFSNGISKLELSAKYGVSRSLISNIILKKRGYE